MAFKAGHKKIAGRAKGTPNKSSLPIEELCAKWECSPVEVLIKLTMDEKEPDRQLAAAKELCQYLYPKRKAVEITTQGYFRREIKKLDGTVDVYTNEPNGEEE